eukprot:TRINITY_DN115_c0_g1_i1.p1 TRINITY_DN115_c0_g1~~TRINITY_DN115_c0_g1_i1.p1  ORF type:complete len:426 (+),score=73.37 TRINITY_DN115_c0_g1_i1:173-1450(+)
MRSLILLLLVAGVICDSTYFLGDQGNSCTETCNAKQMNCNPKIETGGKIDLFKQLGVDCKEDSRDWYALDQPNYVSDSKDPNYGKCLGYKTVPDSVICAGNYPSVRRLCRCDSPSENELTFGTSVASIAFGTKEQFVFNHRVPETGNHYGVLTHFWITYSAATDPGTTIRIYVDDETAASIAFQPAMACGTGFSDTTAPWGTEYFGHGARNGAWFLNFRVPFYKSIVVTSQHTSDNQGYYMIVRGSLDLPISIGGIHLPFGAKMKLLHVKGDFQPLDWVPMADIPSGKGLLFMSTLSVTSGNMNFLEGCFHMYTGTQKDWPGVVLSSGTEDYYDSAWYFDAGQFRYPVSGFTHYKQQTGGKIEWSAYRFHAMDPLRFNDGFKLMWRNGDMMDAAGAKCFIQSGGKVVGSPTVSTVDSYAWVYVWD